MPRRWKLFLIIAPLTLLADQLTKIWARAVLEILPNGAGRSVIVIENFFEWRLSQNPGSAFGLFGSLSGARIFLTVIGIFAVLAIFWMLHQSKDDQTRFITALGLVAGGAIGNLIDRIMEGSVTDFVVWKYHEHEWPTFNVADVALVIGVGLLFLDMLRQPREDSLDEETSPAKLSAISKGSNRDKKKP